MITIRKKNGISKIVFALLLSLCVLVVFATAQELPTLSVSSGEVSAGEEVSLVISISENTGLAALKLELSWDAEVFALRGVTEGKALAGGTLVKNDKLSGKLLIAYGSAQNRMENGSIAELTLKAAENVKSGEYPITLEVTSFADEEGNKTEPKIISGSITVAGAFEEPPVEEDTPADDGSSSGTAGSGSGGGSSSGGSGGGGGNGFVPAIPTVTTPQNPTSGDTSESEPETEPQTKSNPFFDVGETDFYYDAVLWAVENNITSGMTKVMFAPASACTRAQTVTFLWRAAGSPKAEKQENPFGDVSAGAYYYDAVLWAKEQGITSGTSENTFSPDKTISRAETVTFLYRFAKGGTSSGKNPFADVSDGAYYHAPVLWAVGQGITKGVSETSFEPSSPCTRAQIVTFIYRNETVGSGRKE